MDFADQLRDVEEKARSPFDKSARTKFGRGGPVNPVLGGLALIGLAYALGSPVPALLGAAAYWVTRKPNP